MTQQELNQIITRVAPTTSEGADLLLDLRELLMSRGHAGKCVRCFFGLMGDLRQPGALQPLRHWLEQHLEVEVSSEGREIDVFPVRLGDDADLESYCHRAIETIRNDRSFSDNRIALRFRYKDDVAVA